VEKIHYKKFGKGRSVVFLHGFCETHEIWDGFAESLSKKFEIYTVDLPGFGKSPLPAVPLTVDDVGLRILRWMEETKIDHPVIIGHSLGGYVTLAMASHYSDKLAAIGLFHSTPYQDNEERKSNRNRVIRFVTVNGVASFVDTFVPGLFFNKKHPSIPRVYEIALKTPKETLLGYTTAMRDRCSFVDVLKDFDKPMLVLAGEKDTIIPVESVSEFGHLARNSTVHILKDTAHMAMFEAPEIAEAIIADFVQNI
jgi:pimeloyl-ACP methyl ester carboxylesterase